MTRRYFGLAAVAAFAAGLALLIATGCSNDDGATNATDGATETARERGGGDHPGSTSPDSEQGPGAPTETLRLESGEPVGGPAKVEVEKGTNLTLVVESDQPEEIHLHGYDLTETAEPGAPARMAVDANLEGVFEIETHATGTLIGNLAVTP